MILLFTLHKIYESDNACIKGGEELYQDDELNLPELIYDLKSHFSNNGKPFYEDYQSIIYELSTAPFVADIHSVNIYITDNDNQIHESSLNMSYLSKCSIHCCLKWLSQQIFMFELKTNMNDLINVFKYLYIFLIAKVLFINESNIPVNALCTEPAIHFTAPFMSRLVSNNHCVILMSMGQEEDLNGRAPNKDEIDIKFLDDALLEMFEFKKSDVEHYILRYMCNDALNSKTPHYHNNYFYERYICDYSINFDEVANVISNEIYDLAVINGWCSEYTNQSSTASYLSISRHDPVIEGAVMQLYKQFDIVEFYDNAIETIILTQPYINIINKEEEIKGLLSKFVSCSINAVVVNSMQPFTTPILADMLKDNSEPISLGDNRIPISV